MENFIFVQWTVTIKRIGNKKGHHFPYVLEQFSSRFPAGIFLLKVVKNVKTRTMCEIYLNLQI